MLMISVIYLTWLYPHFLKKDWVYCCYLLPSVRLLRFFLSYTALTLYELNKQTFYVCSIRRIGQRGEQWGTDKEYTDSSAVIYEIETLFKVTARIDEKLDKLIGHMHSWDLL